MLRPQLACVTAEGVRSNVGWKHILSCPIPLTKEPGFYLFGSWKTTKLTMQGINEKRSVLFSKDMETPWKERRRTGSYSSRAGDMGAKAVER